MRRLSMWKSNTQTFGDHACHPERSEGSGSLDGEILRFAQDDRQDLSQVRSREVFSPNVWAVGRVCELLLRDKGSRKGEERKIQIPIFSTRSLPRWIVSHKAVSSRHSQKKTNSAYSPRLTSTRSSSYWKPCLILVGATPSAPICPIF